MTARYNIDFSEHFFYDETSPTFLRHKTDKWAGKWFAIKRISAGEVAGKINNQGYVDVKFKGKMLCGHHIVINLHKIQVPEGHLVDHIDGNRSNNTLNNLRCIPATMNARNNKKMRNNSSGVTGVSWRLSTKYNTTHAVAIWRSLDGKQVTKCFNVNKLGLLVAFRDAVLYREKMISEMNAQGAGYTERHGVK